MLYELRARGYTGPDAVTRFQREFNAANPGRVPQLNVGVDVGPAMCAVLGVDVPAGVVWRS